MEELLGAYPAVRQVRANPTTASLLVLFDPRRLALAALMVEVNRCVREVGLASDEFRSRLATVGPNAQPAARQKPAREIITGHLTSLPVALLGGAAALSLATGGLAEASAILGVVAANTAIGYATESRVERVLAALPSLTTPQARVRRDGAEIVIAASTLVPGDVLALEAGHDIAADARLVEADGLAVDESALTGESVPAAKTASRLCRRNAVVADRVNMVHAGTVVVEGHGLAVVTGTGRHAELGRVRTLVSETVTPSTPLERQLDDMGGRLVGVSLGACGA
jgi:Ca2+-transporting ATPase